jgi:hypothetical protein
MFRAVRDSSAKAGALFHGYRLQRTARLFIFELLVVIVGVLIAQGLANLVGDRATQRQVSEEHSRLDFELGRSRQTSEAWRVAIPCLRKRVDALMDASESGRSPLLERDIAMPGGGYYMVEPISSDIARPFRDRYGADRSDIYFLANETSHRIADNIYEARQEWAKFGLLSLGPGRLNEIDKSQLRAAGIRVRWLLKTIDSQAGAMDELGRQLGIAPIASDNAIEILGTPVSNCDEIWRNNSIYHVVRG